MFCFHLIQLALVYINTSTIPTRSPLRKFLTRPQYPFSSQPAALRPANRRGPVLLEYNQMTR